MESTKENEEELNQGIDLEKAPVPEVLQTLAVDPKVGLSQLEAAQRLEKYGPNALTEKVQSFWSKLMHHFMGPIAYMIEAAALVSAIIGHWDDFIIILALLLFNVTIEMIQDRKANSALTALKQGLAPEATVLRDGEFSSIPASELVPGDIVKIRLGMIVPADMRLVEGDYVSIDQAALTGESLPVTKGVGAEAYSGSVVKQGEMLGVVTATGSQTFFGRTAKLVANAGVQSHAQKAMFQIGNFLIVVAVILATIMVAFRVYRDIFVTGGWGMTEALNILQFVLVLLVASIPVAMPTVFSITLALGAIELSKEKAIVSKLAAIEEMAGVDILCSDKTGTLTKNELSLDEPILIKAHDAQECIIAGALASKLENKDAIDLTIISAVKDPEKLKAWTLDKFIPFDPITKRTEGRLHNAQGDQLWVSKGAPQVIVELVHPPKAEADKIMKLVDDLANKGYRALGVAESKDEGKTWEYLGVLPMFDPPRDDSAATIKAAQANGVSVKMITGDDTAIAIETARQLGMGTNILNASEFFPKDMDPDHVPAKLAEVIERADGFARVFPEHKYAIVKVLQKRGHIVAMTGDGVNDAPALKQADCGVAVADATDAARGAADLILTAPGLSVIETAIKEARQIFERITSYTVYRVALTITIMFLVVLSSIIFNFQPLTAIMIVIMSLLDDIPIMAIAYDNTSVSPRPIRWKMAKILSVSTILGFFAVIQSVALLYMGHHALIQPDAFSWLHVTSFGQLQTIMFLQLVAGGHLLLFITRQSKWFFEKPYPSSILFWSIMATQVVAILMCYFGWLVPAISITTIVVVWGYNLIWMFVLGFVRIASEKYLDNRTKRQRKHVEMVNEKLK
ncbi:plasma-membrane proton-efflux P-type ATPase [Ligilactobacillus ceti]|nr:plasma-membrane proton-efflux P-type ATPase [Ligilactobacillus ceti]